MLGSALLRGWVCRCPSSVPCQTLLCLQTGFDLKYLKESSAGSAMGPGSDAAGTRPPQAQGTAWLCAGVVEESRNAARWRRQGCRHAGAPCAQASIKRSIFGTGMWFSVRGGGCTRWLAGLKGLGWGKRQGLGSPALPSAGRAPRFAPCRWQAVAARIAASLLAKVGKASPATPGNQPSSRE